MISPQRVAKNTLFSLTSAIAQKLITLLYFIAIANHYGPQDQGGYSSALAFATLLAVFVDLGISSAMTREVAREKKAIASYVGQMLFLRIALCIFLYPTMIVAAHFAGYPNAIITMIYVAGFTALLDTFTVAGWATVRGFQNLWYESVAGFFAVLVMVILGFGAIYLNLPIHYLLYAILAGTLVNLFAALFVLFRRCGFVISLKPDIAVIKKMLVFSLPFMGAAIFSRIYTFTDMSLLPLLASAQAAGWYAAANKIMLAMNIIPGAFASSLYPAISASYATSKERAGYLCARGIAYLAALAFPIGAGILLLSGHIMLFVYHETYIPTILVFQLLVPGVIAGFLMFPLGSLLAGVNRQGTNTAIFGIAAVLNLLSNVILIPLFAERGAAISASLTYLWIFFASLAVSWQYVKPHIYYLLGMGMKIFLASSVMAFLIYLIRDAVHVVATVIFGIVAYGVCVFFFGIIQIKELRSFFTANKK